MRHFCLVLSFVLVAFNCSPSPPKNDKNITIEFWTIALGDAFADYINDIIATYEATHPGVRVRWVDVSGGEVAEKFLASLVGNSPPDLANIYDLPRFLQYSVLANMDEFVPQKEKDKRLENFWKGMGYYKGNNYIIPWYSSINMLWCNRALFEAAGLDPNTPPKTIDEMFAMGRTIASLNHS